VPNESGDGNNESGRAVAKHELQGAAIECDDGIESIFGLTIEPALFFFLVKAEELGAHHGSQRQRNNAGDEDGYGQGDSKFAEETPNDITHEEKRNEHGDE